jgi:hypothetical protein
MPLLRGARPAWKPGSVAGERRRPAESSTAGTVIGFSFHRWLVVACSTSHRQPGERDKLRRSLRQGNAEASRPSASVLVLVQDGNVVLDRETPALVVRE